MTTNHHTIINTSFGAIAISLNNHQLCIELMTEQPPPSAFNEQAVPPLIEQASRQIKQYLQQADTPFNLPLIQSGTAFQQRVWQAISAIPLGQTRSYEQIARQLGTGARAVANACGANALPIIVPCHRVVAKNGLGGFMQSKQDGLRIKKWLLSHEGADVQRGEI